MLAVQVNEIQWVDNYALQIKGRGLISFVLSKIIYNNNIMFKTIKTNTHTHIYIQYIYMCVYICIYTVEL